MGQDYGRNAGLSSRLPHEDIHRHHQHAGKVHVHDGVSEDTFVGLRKARDAQLEAPVLILPSLQGTSAAVRCLRRGRAGRHFSSCHSTAWMLRRGI